MTTNLAAHRWLCCLLLVLSVIATMPSAVASAQALCSDSAMLMDSEPMATMQQDPCHDNSSTTNSINPCADSPCHCPPLVLTVGTTELTPVTRAALNNSPEAGLSLYVNPVQLRPPQT